MEIVYKKQDTRYRDTAILSLHLSDRMLKLHIIDRKSKKETRDELKDLFKKLRKFMKQNKFIEKPYRRRRKEYI